MKKFFCFFLPFCFCFLCACNNHIVTNKESNDENISETCDVIEQTKTTILFGIKSPDPNKRVLEYNGAPIKISFNAKNGPTKAEWGLRVYVAGYLQEFSVGNQVCDLYRFKTNEEDEVSFDLSFMPVVGNAGDELTVNFILYLNPSYVLRDPNYVGYDNNHKISQLLPWKLIINKSVETSTPQSIYCDNFTNIPDSIVDEFTSQFDENNQRINSLETETFIEHFQIKENYNTISVHNSTFDTFIHGYGNAEKYRVSLYVNHELVDAFNGEQYCILEVKKNFLSEITTKVSYNFEGKDNFAYIIAVPIAEKYDLYSSDVIKTNSMKIILE